MNFNTLLDIYRKEAQSEREKVEDTYVASGELSGKEGGKIFGSGSRTPIAITILVKKKTK
jgi:hypothetical protein